MISRCFICGKYFDILYPNMWRYKNRDKHHNSYTYFCSYKCTRKYDNEEYDMEEEHMKRNKRITKEQKEQAVEIAISGGNPVAYLDSCGIADAQKCWTNIKSRLSLNDREKYAEIMNPKGHVQNENRIPPPPPPPPGYVATVKVDGPLKIETKEPEKVDVVKKPVGIPVAPPFEYRVTGIDTAIGSFQYFKKNQYLDWTEPNGAIVSMHLKEWKEFMKLWPFVLKALGVKL